MVIDIVSSPYLIAAVVAWILAQGGKYLLDAFRQKRFNVRQLYFSGGMPSAHSATTVALATIVGFKDGFDSGLFALAMLVSAIAMYDAMMVRRSAGEQGLALQHMIREQKSKAPVPRAAKGHTPAEVAVGALLGLITGIVVFLATK